MRCREFVALGLRIVSQRVCLKLLAVSKIEADSAIKFTAKPRTYPLSRVGGLTKTNMTISVAPKNVANVA